MPDYQPIDYRLRCHTKRTDLPADVLRDIGEAYAEIGRLQRERDEARLEVCGLHHLTGFLAGDYANSRGWDCFKDHPRGLEFHRLSRISSCSLMVRKRFSWSGLTV